METNFPNQAMQLISKIKYGFALLVLGCCSVASAAGLTEFEAQYKAYQYGRELGEATLKLESLGRQKYRLAYQSKISFFFLSDMRKEVSLFSFENDTITPFKYTYQRTGFGSDKDLLAEFNRQDNSILVNKEQKLTWHDEFDNQLYRLDIQLQLSNDKTSFKYNLINSRGELRHYDMLVLDKEPLELPYGSIEGIKVKLMRENSKRETFAWFAPSLNYQLVRLQQFKDGEEQGDIQLARFQSAN
ncbi:DUF3108 domain-containing protein [Aliiglaciecola sp. LCG003]|uniref:DUF3108 domain-containing protein n=1 Tax=Aliiglaciecola sp. LCG003 TaxID=3053655 RepID=UPI0025722B87|nr:DUF3108 domain-containing protein [Aliiglaciecola sp. LCG003]WJG11137.1 DUF3108 domain-containing protein [Aliiglaciecola sp. LCG003]